MLARLGWQKIHVFDRLAPPQRADDAAWGNTDRSYNIGVTETGIMVLEQLGAAERVRELGTPLLRRKQWTPESGGKAVWSEQKNRDTLRRRDTIVRSLHSAHCSCAVAMHCAVCHVGGFARAFQFLPSCTC